MNARVIVVTGPRASGKSAFAGENRDQWAGEEIELYDSVLPRILEILGR